MEIVMLGSHVIKKFLLIKLLKAQTTVVYSTMIPYQSPDFSTKEDLIQWFNSQPRWAREKFHAYGYFIIYGHEIAIHEGMTSYGYLYSEGEVLSTFEAEIYDYSAKVWL